MYQFRHYNSLTENPLIWSSRYDAIDHNINSIEPSAASNSLLSSLISLQNNQFIMYYSRPAAWADIKLSKAVNANGTDLIIDNLRLEVQYDFTRKNSGEMTLEVMSEEGLMPYFIISKKDINNRQDGRGNFHRTYEQNPSEKVTITAPERYGMWQFERWTDRYGHALGINSSDRVLELNLSTDQTIYAHMKKPDTTPPLSVTKLQNTTYAPTYINWTWTNPPDPDYSRVMLYLNGNYNISIPAPQNYYNFTGLQPDTLYTLGTRTVDSSGNVNTTLANATARTASKSTSTPSITVFAPNGGEVLQRGSVQKIQWNITGKPGTYVRIELLKGGVLNRVIITATPNDGIHLWSILSTQTPGNDYKIRITSTTNAAYTDTSDGYFTIPPPNITVRTPNDGENWRRGTTQTIRWNSSGAPGAYVKIELLKGGSLNRVIITSTPNDGSHPWLIPATQMPGNDYKIKITSTTNPAYSDTSDNNFNIPVPSFTIFTPNGGENWRRGTTQTIRWNSTESPGSYVKIELLKPGVANRLIVSSTINDGSHPWLIPTTMAPGNDYKIKITGIVNPAINDTSDNNFTIPFPSFTIVSPNGGENWIKGTTQTIKWNSTEIPGSYVKMELLKPGVANKLIISSTLNDGSHSWLIPATQVVGSDYKIKITGTTNASNNDTSDNNFNISSPINVVIPNGGETWQRGTTQLINWTSVGSPGAYVKIELLKAGVLNRVIASSTLNDRSHPWFIPATQVPGSDYKIRITSTGNLAYTDTSNNNFNISS